MNIFSLTFLLRKMRFKQRGEKCSITLFSIKFRPCKKNLFQTKYLNGSDSFIFFFSFPLPRIYTWKEPYLKMFLTTGPTFKFLLFSTDWCLQNYWSRSSFIHMYVVLKALKWKGDYITITRLLKELSNQTFILFFLAW